MPSFTKGHLHGGSSVGWGLSRHEASFWTGRDFGAGGPGRFLGLITDLGAMLGLKRKTCEN